MARTAALLPILALAVAAFAFQHGLQPGQLLPFPAKGESPLVLLIRTHPLTSTDCKSLNVAAARLSDNKLRFQVLAPAAPTPCAEKPNMVAPLTAAQESKLLPESPSRNPLEAPDSRPRRNPPPVNRPPDHLRSRRDGNHLGIRPAILHHQLRALPWQRRLRY